ncbi:MAG: hypothetical protein COC22_06805 [Flavobacteriaceae bacterium]|nr:MAG: hypothetical protein COC22_06805 [Flavobacteriaceae bacterium]
MARTITYKDIEYSSLKACIEANAIEGLSYANVQARLKIGWTLEKALTEPVPEKYKKTYTVDAITYNTLKELGDKFGLKHDQLYARARRGWTDQEIAYGKVKKAKEKEVKKNLREITINGVTYPCIAQMCKQHNVKMVTYRHRIKSGWSIEEAIGVKQRIDGRKNKKGNLYTVNNKTYYSVCELSREFNVNENTIRDRLKKGHSIEIAIGIVPMPKIVISHPKRRTYEFNNKTYKSLREISEVTGIKEGTLWGRISRTGMSIEDAVAFEVHGNEVVCHGRTYPSISALAAAYNLPGWKVHQRIYKRGYTPEEAISDEDKRLSSQDDIIVNNVKYKSFMDACEKLNFTVEAVKNRLQEGASLSEAFDNNWTANPIIVEGKKFKNIALVAKHYGISKDRIYGRISKGYSIEEAVEIVPAKFSNSGRYNDIYFERNPDEANLPSVLYFVQFKEKATEVLFHKVGITKYSVEQRFYNYSKYDLEIINTINLPLKEAYDLEQMLVKDLSRLSYVPDESFEGRTECYQLSDSILSQIKDMIENFKQDYSQ